ncbi:MAG: hypothetical protein IJT83_05235 [Victivallales bacterium]|nr:hypothetical protein [Victivallales bacterium]
MKITVLKSTVESALTPILKMVSCSKVPIDFHPTLTFKSDKHSVWLRCALMDNLLESAMPDAVCDDKNASFDVNLETFKEMVAKPTGTRLSIEQDTAHVRISLDDRFIGSLVPMKSKEVSLFEMPKENDLTILPTNFANFLIQAFSCTGDGKDRLVLSGVNVSSKGIAATDGKQLFHLPLPLQLKSDVTIPPSRCYAALKGMRWFSLAHWRNVYGNSMFAIVGEGFRYVAKAIDGTYPNYHQVISASENGDVTFTLTPDGAKSLSAFINDDKNDAFFDLTVYPDKIELRHEYDVTRKGTFGAVSRSVNLPCKVSLNIRFLRQFLKMGFMSMSLSSKSPSPLISTSGVGKYLFMPCGSANRNSASAPTQAATSAPPPAPSPKPSVNPATISNTTNNKAIQTLSTNNQKEKQTMTQTITAPTAIRPTATFNAPAPTVNPTTAPVNPLEETLSSIAAMREQLSNLEARLMEAGRKIKAALVEQKLKERQYADANRKLERIRLAV